MHKKIEKLHISKNRKSLLVKNSRPTQGGQAMIISVVSFVVIFILTTYGLISPTIRDYNIASNGTGSKQSLFLSESGLEDAFYRIKNSRAIGSVESIALAYGTVDTNIAINTAIERTVTATSDVSSKKRITQASLLKHDRIVFPYSIQVGDGGVNLENSSQVIGETFSNGPVVGASLNSINGSVISAGPFGLINNIASTLFSKAHSIQNSSIGTDAYYTDITNTTVNGSPCYNLHCYPNTTDTPKGELPVPDSIINEWKNTALAGGVIGPGAPCVSGVYTMTAVPLGAKRILCDVVLTGTTNATISGHLWIVGKFTMNGMSTITVGGNGTESFAIVVDNPSNRITSSSVSLTHVGAVATFGGNPGTFILISSAHDYVASGGTSAITMLNSVNGSLIAYAKAGQIEAQQSVNVAAVSGYKVLGRNSSILGIRPGPVNPDFPTIPVNQWRSTSWKEI